MKLDNDQICPEDLVRIVLPASKIPDSATVRLSNVPMKYILRRNLKIYGSENLLDDDPKPMEFRGFFPYRRKRRR